MILFAILVLIFAWNVFGFWGKMEETAKNKKTAEDKIVDLQKQKDKLSNDISKLNTDQGVEENIRDKFGLAKPGEGMIVVVDDTSKPPAPPSSVSSKFLGFFKNLFR